MKQLVNRESCYLQAWRQRTSLWTSAKLIPALFRANTLHNRLFSEPTHYTTDSFQSQHTKQPALFRANTLNNRLFSEPTHYTTGSFQSQDTKQPALFTANTLNNRSFQSQHTIQPALFRATNSLPRKTHCFTSFLSQLFKSKLSK